MHDQSIRLLDRPEAAGILHVSVRTVRRLGKAGHLEEVRVDGRNIRITEDSVRQHILRRSARNTEQGVSAA